jgi:hypothetical protein
VMGVETETMMKASTATIFTCEGRR